MRLRAPDAECLTVLGETALAIVGEVVWCATFWVRRLTDTG